MIALEAFSLKKNRHVRIAKKNNPNASARFRVIFIALMIVSSAHNSFLRFSVIIMVFFERLR